jgi:hypothetical protein
MKLPCALSAALLAASLSLPVHAQQGVSLGSGFTDFTTWNLFGSAQAQNVEPGNGFRYSNLILTTVGTGDQGGAGFAPTALSIDFNQAFSFDFHFFIPANANGIRGDGLTFVMSSAAGLGNAGSGLGYEGLGSASLALAVDTFHFDGEPVSPSLQLLQGGSVTPVAATETGLGDAIRDPNFQWTAQLSYTPSGDGDQRGTLLGSISHPDLGSFSVQAAVDFDALGLAGVPVYYGFTASNGLADDGHYITSAAPVPEPGSWALWLAGLALGGRLLRRR